MTHDPARSDYNKTMRQYMQQRCAKRRRWAVGQLGGKCASCGTRRELQIDHVDPTKKEMNTGRMLMVGQARFEKELAKCQLLCASCHADKTTIDLGRKPARGTHGTLSSYRYCRCTRCRAAKNKHSREFKQKQRRAAGVPERHLAQHGMRSMYARGCRCAECKIANKEYARMFRLKRKVPCRHGSVA